MGQYESSTSRGRECERGTALLLVPVGVLIVALLASITVDSAAVFVAQREAASAASSLANDLLTLAIDEAALRRHGVYRLDPSRLRHLLGWAQRTASDRLSSVFEPGSISVAVSASGPAAVRVSVSGSARRIIGLIGDVSGARTRRIEAQAAGHVRLSG
ncbi:hypothetical protein [Candidatus Poriferisodalis sp.]|uniref:hypothetical protein n=1 Tax=Candidatus Poriferisodalis sp. TaxID=3101277 RepID=UPI003B01EA18